MFGPEVERAAQAHARTTYPQECCGVVDGAGSYVPLPNVADDKRESFQLPAGAIVDHGAQAVIHSHCAPRHDLAPSASDMRGQIETVLPWGIIRSDGRDVSPILWWGDFRLEEPLIGREFIDGVTDCYSLIRSWYWQKRQIKLLEFPRDAEWWKAGGDLYRKGFAKAGFRQIAEGDVAVGDVVLLSIRSPVPNHGGIVEEGSLLLHHLQGRLSRREPLGPWRKFITHWLRYEGLKQ